MAVQAYPARADGSGVAVSPEYWVSLLWKQLMGRGVLAVSGGGGVVRVYAAVRGACISGRCSLYTRRLYAGQIAVVVI